MYLYLTNKNSIPDKLEAKCPPLHLPRGGFGASRIFAPPPIFISVYTPLQKALNNNFEIG